MTKKCLFLLVLPTVTFADDDAVLATNYAAGVAYSSSDNSDAYSLRGSATLPLTNYSGLTFDANARRRDGKDTVVGSDSGSAGVEFFARDSGLGKIGLGYSFSHSEYDAPDAEWFSTPEDEMDFHQYRVFADYYVSRLTLGIARTLLDTEHADIGDFNASLLSLSWYPGDNTRLRVSAQGMDARETYGVLVEYQPYFLNNSTSVHLSYTDYENGNQVGAGINLFLWHPRPPAAT